METQKENDNQIDDTDKIYDNQFYENFLNSNLNRY